MEGAQARDGSREWTSWAVQPCRGRQFWQIWRFKVDLDVVLSLTGVRVEQDTPFHELVFRVEKGIESNGLALLAGRFVGTN